MTATNHRHMGFLAGIAGLAVLCWVMALPVVASAATTINVPANQPTIQAAIDAAATGDEIVVAPGTYNERIDFKGKAITVRSSGGRWVTTINGGQAGTVVTFATGEGPGSVLRGFSIQHGKTNGEGGGVRVEGASPSIIDNQIAFNEAATAGGGIAVVNGSPVISGNWIDSNKHTGGVLTKGGAGMLIRGTSTAQVVGNRISGNISSGPGGGVTLFGAGSGVALRNNTIDHNRSAGEGAGVGIGGSPSDVLLVQNRISFNTTTFAAGGGVYFDVPADTPGPTLVNNTIAENASANSATGVLAVMSNGSTAALVNNILTGPAGKTVIDCNDLVPSFFNNDVWNGDPVPTQACGSIVGSNGNLSVDPRFTNRSEVGGDLHLKAPSPVIDAGLSGVPGLTATDLEGVTRVADGDGDGVASVDMGAYETPATNNRSAWGWGWNPVGQVGDGTTVDRHVPTNAPIPPGMVSVSAGGYHTLGLKADGTVWAWGWNAVGQLGDGTAVDRHSPVQVPGLTDVVAISAGTFHSLALKSDGTVWGWGWNPAGQVGDGSTVNRHSPVQVAGLTSVTSIAAGGYHSLAVKPNGTVWAWGWNPVGQLGDGTTVDHPSPVQAVGLTGATAVAAGALHSMALAGWGEVWTWGWNGVGQLGDGTTTTRLAPTKLPGLSFMVAIAAGAYHSLALEVDTHLRGWGWNAVGQLGDGTTTDRLSPVTVHAVHPRAIAAGGYHSLAADDDGRIYGWGWNGVGQIGDGTVTTRLEPAYAAGNRGYIAFSAGLGHSAAAG